MYLVEVGIVTVIEQKQHSSWSGYINEASLTEIAAYPMCDIGPHSHKKTLLEPIVVHCPMTLLGVHVSQILVMLLYCL